MLLASKKDELTSKEQEITAGKLLMTMEMDKAKAKLEDGEATLNEKMEEFESAKEEGL